MKITKISFIILFLTVIAYWSVATSKIKTGSSIVKYVVKEENTFLQEYRNNENQQSSILVKKYFLEINNKNSESYTYYDSQELHSPILLFD
ncbi:MAG: hypothetical protein ACK53D_06710, partial [Pseudanabaena sp.]